MEQAKKQIEEIKRQKSNAAASLQSPQVAAVPANPVMKTESEYEYEEYYGTEYSETEIQASSQKQDIIAKVEMDRSPQKSQVRAPSPEIKKALKLKEEAPKPKAAEVQASSISIKYGSGPAQKAIDMSQKARQTDMSQKSLPEQSTIKRIQAP